MNNTINEEKTQNNINSGSLENAINMVDNVYNQLMDALELRQQDTSSPTSLISTSQLNKITDYLGTSLDILKELDTKGVFVTDKKKQTEGLESEYAVNVFKNGTSVNYVEFDDLGEAEEYAEQMSKEGKEARIENTFSKETIEVYGNEENNLTEAKTGVDSAVETIMSLHKDGNEEELDEQWLNDDIQLTIQNTEELANAVNNTRRPAHSVAYQGLLQALNNRSDVTLTGNQIQSAFKKLGLDFKQVIKPTVDWIEEERKDNKEESKKVESEELTPETISTDNVETVDVNNIVNPNDEGYYENNYTVNVVPGTEMSSKQYDVFANNEEQALAILCAFLEQECPDCLINCEDVTPEETNLIYVDGTEYGATKPYYINIQESVSPLTEDVEDTNDLSDEIYEIVEYMYDESEQDLDYIPDIEDIQDTINEECNEDMYNKAVNIVKNIIESIEYYEDTRNKYIQLSDNHTMYELNSDVEITFDQYSSLVETFLQRLQDEINVTVYALGRSGRHICIDNTFDNALNYNKYVEAQSKYEQEMINYINENFGSKTESKELTEADEVEEEQPEEETLLDALQNRIGQSISVGELNTLLQNLFGQYDKIFLTISELYDIEDWDEPQELIIEDDRDMYIITYTVNMNDIENPLIEITDVELE